MAGGYIYEQQDLSYDQNTNGATVRSWGLAVHIARCEAFMRAAKREFDNFGGNGWASIQTNLYDEFSEWLTVGEQIYIQDIHPVSADIGSAYPAFVTFFRNNGGLGEYCILTYSAFNANPSYADPIANYSHGLYINKTNLLRGVSNSSYVACGESLSHAFAKSGFSVYDVGDGGFVAEDSTKIVAAFATNEGYDSNDLYENSSLVRARYSSASNSLLVNKTYQFGYAIKQDQIIALLRRSDNTQWRWSIIGNIISTFIDQSDNHGVAYLMADQYNPHETDGGRVGSGGNNESNKDSSLCFCKTDGMVYSPSDSNVYCDWTRATAAYGLNGLSTRTATAVSEDIRYNAVGVGAKIEQWSSTIADAGVDGNGNGGKGFIDTNLLRQVGAGVCATSGARLQGGNFVSIQVGSSNSISSQVGYVLGWDPSNQSIM